MGIMTIPTIVTSFRLCLVPVVMVGMLIQAERSWWTEAAFILASGTDWLDGYLARRLDQETELGRFLDPLVDKLLVLGPLLIFIQLGILPAWPVFIILTRDLIISGWRVSGQRVPGANRLGKIKTICQLVAIGCLLGPSHFIDALPLTGFLSFTYQLGHVLFWLSVVLTVTSGVIYLRPSEPSEGAE
jgi:CDP-diacylglycerol---glycerol-3-phosphate 3-phosphatidyltransferase